MNNTSNIRFRFPLSISCLHTRLRKMKSPSSSIVRFAAASSLYISLPAPTKAWSVSTSATAFHSTASPRSLLLKKESCVLFQPMRRETERLVCSATIIADEEASTVTPASKPDEHVVSEGVVVSRFDGGMVAVRTLEDATMIGDDASSVSEGIPVLQNTQLLQSRKSSVSGDDLQGKNVVFGNESTGVVVANRPPVVFVHRTAVKSTVAEDEAGVEGIVKILSSRMTIEIPPLSNDGESLSNIDEEEKGSYKRAVFSPIAKVSDIALINNPMLTGITMFDALSPIGRGQNMLLVGHNVDDMRKYTVDFLAHQVTSNPGVKCVYAAIDDVESVTNLLRAQNIIDSVQIMSLVAKKDDGNDISASAEAVATAAMACAVAESYALRDGAHTIVVVDTIDWHKKLWDATTRVLVELFGVDAVVRADREGGASSEMRAYFSTLIQRAAQYKKSKGGGSVTLLLLTEIPCMQDEANAIFQQSDFDGAGDKVKSRIQLLLDKNIPLTAENLRKIDIPIPSASEGRRRLTLQHIDDLISMTDGQIWFDEKLETNGQSPAMDPQRSVTRVGIGADTKSRADAPALRKIVEGMRLILSQAEDLKGAKLSAGSEKQIRRQKAYLLAMHQVSGAGGRKLSESCAALLAASSGYLDDVIEEGSIAGTERGTAIMTGLLVHLRDSIPDQMREIDETLDISDETKKAMSEAICNFLDK